MKKSFNSIIAVHILCSVFFLFGSCRRYLEVPPPANQLVKETVFGDDQTAIAAQLSIYAQMEAESFLYNLTVYPGLSADELLNYSTANANIDLATNNLGTENSLVLSLWSRLYNYIYQANSVLEGLERSPSVGAAVSKQLRGEASFIRAWCHFYLVNFFGEVPLVLSTDYQTNATMKRVSADQVYSQIIVDLQQAQDLLTDQYVNGTNMPGNERVRPNKSAAEALLSRVYLYKEQWAGAEAEADSVISKSATYQLVSNPDEVFLKNSPEAIWQVLPVIPGFNTVTGGYLVLTTSPGTVALSADWLNNLAAIDLRKTSWVKSIDVGGQTYYYPHKYKMGQNTMDITEYTIMLRLSELFLSRAEARAQLGNLDGAASDLNTIRTRAGLDPIAVLPREELLDSIYQERNRELFTEFGHRWFDLIRTDKANDVLFPIKSSWNSTDTLYPIPQSEINRNRGLSQNPGY